LLLTYNSKLKIETRDKIKQLNIFNLEVHSYHSFCVKYYDNECYTDSNIINVIKNNTKTNKIFKYDIIILDESQDINLLYFELICKIFKDNNNINVKICILGDEKQSIFSFNNSDERFIILADKIFTFNNRLWIRKYLSTSFRITFEMSQFINNCMFKNKRIISSKKTNIKPRYIICDSFGKKYGTSDKVFEEVKFYLERCVF
jgi:ATP-dependent exoDNAse (exonuclease V) beta subunit